MTNDIDTITAQVEDPDTYPGFGTCERGDTIMDLVQEIRELRDQVTAYVVNLHMVQGF